MDRDELILQKLTELSTELKEVRTELKEVRTEFSTDLKDIRTELKETRTELFTELKEVRAEFSTDLKDIRIEFSTKLANVQKFVDRIQQDVGDVKLRQADFRNDSQAADSKLAGDIQGLETKIDGVTSSIRERKSDFVERVKMGGIIGSGIIAIAALIHTIFFS